jgi:hypothetical protein
MINKLQLIVKMHGKGTNNVGQTQIRQKQAYASWKGKHMFFKFQEGKTYVKMKKLGKKMSMVSNCERPFLFVKYLDGNGFLE